MYNFRFRCYYCGTRTVKRADRKTYEACGLNGDGIMQLFQCEKCGAFITYILPPDRQKDEDYDEEAMENTDQKSV